MGIRAIREKLEELFRNEVKDTDYLMIDETCTLIGMVKNDQKSFKKKYIWAFYAHLKKMVYYLYEQGSRARKVVTDFLDTFCGYISSDGYVAYSVFDDAEKYPEIIRCGCWTHARHYLVDAYITDNRMKSLLLLINALFYIEQESVRRKHTPEQRFKSRLKYSRRIVEKIMKKLESIRLAGKEYDALVHRAVNYILDDKEAFQKFLLDGRIEMHNNAIERMFRHIAIGRRNWLHTGSHFAAENIAFMYSLLESCKLNNVDFGEYVEDILTD